VAGVRLGVRYYAAEMALRRALDSLQHGDRTLDQLNADHRLNDILYAGQGPLAARVRALGLWMRINAFWADASPALDDLRQAIGPERLRRVLVSIATAGTGTNESMRVACLLSRATGQPVTAWMGRYIPPALASFLPAGRCP